MQFLGVQKWCTANVLSDTYQTHVCWKTCKVSKNFGCVTEYIFYNVKLVEVCKMSEVFRAKLYCNMSDLFASFSWF